MAGPFRLCKAANGFVPYGEHRQLCREDGHYEQKQCYGDECYCVDKNGNEISGTFKQLPKETSCLLPGDFLRDRP